MMDREDCRHLTGQEVGDLAVEPPVSFWRYITPTQSLPVASMKYRKPPG